MTTPLIVLAAGARAPLGLRAAPIAAAFRAGINRLGEHPTFVDRDGDPVPTALDLELAPDLEHSARLCAFVETALWEICSQVPRPAAPPTVRLFLALPEFRPGFTPSDARRIRSHLAALANLPFSLRSVELFPLGHAGGAVALSAAARAVAAGEEWCLVGGVESYLHPDTLDWLESHDQLAGTGVRSAFVPGEGAAVLLVARAPWPPSLPGQAWITGIGVATEAALIKTEARCIGLGLTRAIEDACSQLPAGHRIGDLVCDLNGERYRSQEWGFTCLRIAHYLDDAASYRAPAGSWGDMGAASIPLFTVLACQAAARGYAPGPYSLVWAGSEGGQRGALLIQNAVTPRSLLATG